MRYVIALLLVFVSVFAFRKVRDHRIAFTAEQKRKKDAMAAANTETRSWKKLNIRDVRPERRIRDDAPSYTSHTEQTGRYKIPTGTFKTLTETGSYKI